jgi:HNH endonuclease
LQVADIHNHDRRDNHLIAQAVWKIEIYGVNLLAASRHINRARIGTAWRKLRDSILKRDYYLCQVCKAKGRVTAANEVDHRTPKAKGGTDDETNLQSICTPCHRDKSAADKGCRVKPTIGLDGFPIEW